MCGRYSSSRDPGDLISEFEIDQPFDQERALNPDYNVAPTKPIYAVVGAAAQDEEGKRIADASRYAGSRWSAGAWFRPGARIRASATS
jgi:putative SOS response-associated peptidase YedK